MPQPHVRHARRRGLRLGGLALSALLARGPSPLPAQVHLQPATAVPLAIQRDGRPQPLAWSGGLNNPQFYSIDVDGDGRLETYAFDRAGGVHLAFGAGAGGELVDVSAAARGFPRATRFVVPADFDGDGVVDLFASSFDLDPGGAQGMFVYRGRRGADGTLAFARVDFPTRFPSLLTYRTADDRDQLVYVAGTDVPVVRDLDGDGDVDVLAFEPSGSYVYYYENVAAPDASEPAERLRFRLASRCYGGVYEDNLTSELELAAAPGACADPAFGPPPKPEGQTARGGAHPGSTLTADDLDGDGDLDLLVGDVQTGRVAALYNEPAGATAYYARVSPDWPTDPATVPVELDFLPGVFPVAAPGAAVGTGPTEYLVSGNAAGGGENVANVWRYVRDAGGLRLTTRSRFTDVALDHGTGSHPAVGQLDGEGAPELIVGNEGVYAPGVPGRLRASLRYYRCRAGGDCREEAPPWLARVNAGLGGASTDPVVSYDPTLADLDGDGDLDLVVGLSTGDLAYARNVTRSGGPVDFEFVTAGLLGRSVGLQSSPAVADLDGDGLPDLLVGERNGNLNLFLNRGTAAAPDFGPEPDAEVYGEIEVRLPGFGPAQSRPAFGTVAGERVLYVGTAQGRLLVYGDLPGGPSGSASLRDTLAAGAGDDLDPVSVGVLGDGRAYVFLGNRRGGLAPYVLDDASAAGVRPAEAPDVALAPNPTAGRFEVLGAGPADRLRIADALGRVLVADAPAAEATSWPVLPKGVYYVTVGSPTGAPTTERLVVQ